MKKIYVAAYPYTCGMMDQNFNFRVACCKLDRQTLKKELSEFNPDGIIAGLEVYDKEILDVCPNLKIISRVGSGVDNVDLIYTKQQGIKIFNTPDEPVQAVAELVIGQMISLLRKLPTYPQFLRSFKNTPPKELMWSKRMGKNLSDCNVGIIGMGRIGTRVHSLLQAFGCKKIYTYDIQDFRTTLRDIVENSDILTIHIPLNDYNRNFINKDIFEMMKPNSYIINTSRGGVVNEADLEQYLINGKLAGAALDVFETEPYYGELRFMNKVISTPHIGSYTTETRLKMELKAFTNCIDYLLNN